MPALTSALIVLTLMLRTEKRLSITSRYFSYLVWCSWLSFFKRPACLQKELISFLHWALSKKPRVSARLSSKLELAYFVEVSSLTGSCSNCLNILFIALRSLIVANNDMQSLTNGRFTLPSPFFDSPTNRYFQYRL